MDNMIGIYAGQAALLAPLVVAFAAMVFQAIRLPDRYKPAMTVTIGMVLGVALFYTQEQRLLDGAWVGAIGGLTASGLYYFGKVAEKSGNVAAETKTTTTIYEPSDSTGLPLKPTELSLKPTELPTKPTELPHG